MCDRWNKLVRALQMCFYVFFLCLGFLAKGYDVANQRVLKSRCRTIYVACMNIAVIGCMPYMFLKSAVFLNWAQGSGNDLLKGTDMANIIITFGSAIVTIVKRRFSERCVERTMLGLFALRRQYYDRLVVPDALERRYNRLYLLQAFLSLAQPLVQFHTLLIMSPAINTGTVFLAFYFSSICFILHGVTHYMFVSLWHTRKSFELLNLELWKLRQRLLRSHLGKRHTIVAERPARRQLLHWEAEQLALIARIHWRSTGVIQGLQGAFAGQIGTVTVALILDNIMFGYYMILLLSGTLGITLSFWHVIEFLNCYTLPLLNLFYLYWMCERTMGTFRHTAVVLRAFQTLPRRHADFELQCEAFAMQMVQRPLRIEVAGMCKLNIASFLALAGYIFRHTVIVLQFDFANRFRRRI